MMGDDPPFLTVGTEVSAKYKGAFCEAKVRKVVRSVKCKVTFKLGLGTISITDDQIRGGTLRVGSVCEVKHPEKKEFVEAIINKIQDCSQYTVVFDDGDITTLRRTALCLKSGRHFAESETLDQLPLTHPEHFSNPVIGGRKGRRSRQAQEESSDEDDPPKKGKKKEEKEADIGKVVCVELGDKKKQKDNWFPGLVVAPTAQDTVRIRVKDEYLVRSFKDGRYFTVPKKEATEFTREIGNKVDNHTLKAAVEKALQYLDRDELPPHWDRDLLFGLDESSGNSDSDGALDSDSSDDEPREEKDHFVAQLYKFMDDRGTPINRGPTIGSRDVDLYKLFKVVHKLGGYNRVTNHNQWKTISQKLGFGQGNSSTTNLVKQSYKKFLHSFEDFYRKLGCTMVNHPRGHRSRHRTGRSLIRDRDRATPTIIAKDKEKKDEKVSSATEKSSHKEEKSAETPEKETSSEKKDEEKPREEEKKEEVKAKEPAKKSKVREDKPDVQNKQKTKDTPESSQTVIDEKDNRSRSKKDSKVPETKVPRIFEDLEKEETDTAPEDTTGTDVSEENKSRDLKSKTREIKPKEKSKAASDKVKCKEEKTKVPEDEKNEEVKKKIEKKIEKTEEDEKHTRAKTKDPKVKKEGGSSRDSQETRIPNREIIKPPVRGAFRKEEENPAASFKKRGRKRKDIDDKVKADESMGRLASHVIVCIGDKLKVYYGPTHESKVTYEAKVLDIEEDGSECMYLVHYTGWNTRYDEWIKRGRIADNLSWTPSRAKRQRQQQSQHKTSRQTHGKRGRPSTSARSLESTPNPPRSTTPSSVTSSSSRTKSPATRSTPRSGRSVGDSTSPGREFRRRTRRMSGHTDVSMASDTESEDFESEPEPESEMAQTRSRTTEQRRCASIPGNTSVAPPLTPPVMLEKDELSPVTQICKEESGRKGGATRKKGSLIHKKKDPISSNVNVSIPTEDEEEKAELEIRECLPDVEKRRSRRGKQSPAITSSRSPLQRPKLAIDLKTEVKSELSAGTESDDESTQPKGRDFDLNQIRSELKGIEKAVKSPQNLSPPLSLLPLPGEVADDEDEDEEERKFVLKPERDLKLEVKQEAKIDRKEVLEMPALFADIDKEDEEVKEKSKARNDVAIAVTMNPTTSSSVIAPLRGDDDEEDVYEFREPEPFEFEVRKRATLLPDSKGLSRRTGLTSRLIEMPLPSAESSPPLLHAVTTTIPPVASISSRFSDKSPRKRHIRTPPKDPLHSDGSKKLRRTPQKRLLGEASKSSLDSKEDTLELDSSVSHIQLSIPSPVSSSGSAYSPTRLRTNIEMILETTDPEKSSISTSTVSIPLIQTIKSPNVKALTVDPIPMSNIDDNPVSPPLLSLPDDEDDIDDAHKSPELGALSIFSQGQDDDADDDHEDRLVISESDDMVTEIAEPLFSYQQRDHEDLFPTHVTSKAVVTTAEETESCKAEEPPCLSPVVVPTVFEDFSSSAQEPIDNIEVNASSNRTLTTSQISLQQTSMKPQLLLKQHISQQLQAQQFLEHTHSPLAEKNQQMEHKVTKQLIDLPQLSKQLLDHKQAPKLLPEHIQPMRQQEQLSVSTRLLVHEHISKKPIDLPLSKQQQDHVLLPKPLQQSGLKQKQEQPQILYQQEHSQMPKHCEDKSSQSKEKEELNVVKEQNPLAKRNQEQIVLSKSESPHTSKPLELQTFPLEAQISMPFTIQGAQSSSPTRSSTSITFNTAEGKCDEIDKDHTRHEDSSDMSISTAVQRALDHSIEDEEDTSGDMDFFCGKKSLSTAVTKDLSASNSDFSQKNSLKGNTSPRPHTSTPSRKRVMRDPLSSFLDSEEDSAADSSDDEDQRLVIDPTDYDGSSQPRSCSSPLSTNDLHATDACPRLQLSETEDDADIEMTGDDLRIEDEETINERTLVISHNLSPPSQDDISSASEVVTSARVITEEETMETVDMSDNWKQESNPAGEELENSAQGEDSLGSFCDRITLHSAEASITVEERHESVAPVMTPVIVKVDLDDTSKMAEAEILSGGVVVLDASTELSAVNSDGQSLSAVCHTSATTVVTATIMAASPGSLNSQNTTTNIMCEGTAASDTSPILALAAVPLGEAEAAEMRQEQRSDDAESQLLGSLLCQETIPGSPAQAGDCTSDDPVPESKVLVLEMPFASVPASSCDATNSTISLPVPISVPLNIPIDTTVASMCTTASASTTTALVTAETLHSLPETSSNAPIVTEESIAVAAAAAASAQRLIAVPLPSASKLSSSEAAPVIENTPPTTPDSTLSTMSGSPREEHGDMSPALDNESSKSHRDSFELDLDSCPEGTKVGHFSEEDSLLNVEVLNSCDNRLQGLNLVPKKGVLDLDKDADTSPKKRRRSRKRSECETNKRVRCSSSRSVRPAGGTGSDSDDTSENSALGCTPMASSESTLSSKSPRPSKYNFYVELDPELDGSQRIALLQQKLQELRKTYMNVKAELACIDRRRKKLRRREREVEKAAKQEVTCS